MRAERSSVGPGLDSGVILIKDKKGTVIGFEKLYFYVPEDEELRVSVETHKVSHSGLRPHWPGKQKGRSLLVQTQYPVNRRRWGYRYLLNFTASSLKAGALSIAEPPDPHSLCKTRT